MVRVIPFLLVFLFVSCETTLRTTSSNRYEVAIFAKSHSNNSKIVWGRFLIVQFLETKHIEEKMYYVYQTSDGCLYAYGDRKIIRIIEPAQEPYDIGRQLGKHVFYAYYN